MPAPRLISAASGVRRWYVRLAGRRWTSKAKIHN
jgi:hypothetical protein